MGHLNPTITPDPVAASRREFKLPRRPALALAGALTVLCLTAAACGRFPRVLGALDWLPADASTASSIATG